MERRGFFGSVMAAIAAACTGWWGKKADASSVQFLKDIADGKLSGKGNGVTFHSREIGPMKLDENGFKYYSIRGDMEFGPGGRDVIEGAKSIRPLPGFITKSISVWADNHGMSTAYEIRFRQIAKV